MTLVNFFFFGRHTFGMLRNSFVQSRWCVRLENNHWQVLWREPVGSGKTSVPVLSWEYCICVMLCILFQTYENGGLGPVLGIRWHIINGPERSSQCCIFRHTLNVLRWASHSCIFLLLLSSLFLGFLLIYWKETSFLFLEVFSLCLRFWQYLWCR